MRVLMTGASGFIGTELRRRLRERGDIVVPVTRRPPATGEVGIDLARGRLDLSRIPGGTLDGIDASVHLAGAPIFTRWTAKSLNEIRSSRIALGTLVAQHLAGLERKPGVHVTVAATGFYGERGEELLDETSAPGSGTVVEICKAWESAADPARIAGIRTVAIRTGIVLGRGGGALKAQLPLFKLGLGGRLGSGKQWVSWVSLEDEVNAILLAVDDNTVTGPVNSTSPNPVSNSQFTAALARAVKRPARLAVPPAALRLAFGGAADELLLASQRIRPSRLMELGYTFVHPSIEEALVTAIS